MKTLSSTTDLISRYYVMGSFAAQTFAPHPTFQGVIAQFLNEQWLAKFPTRRVDINRVTLAEQVPFPDPFSSQADTAPLRYRDMPLIDVMIQSYIDGTPVRLLPGVHRLSSDALVDDLHLLSVGIEQVQSLINDCAPLLVQAYQYALTRYWSEQGERSPSPVRWLSQVLQGGLTSAVQHSNPRRGLSPEQAVALTVVASFPDKAERLLGSEETPLHAYLVTVARNPADLSDAVHLPGLMLVTRQMPGRLLVLSYSPEQGIERFDSIEAFGLSLSRYPQSRAAGDSFNWGLHEPDGHFFTALALTLLDQKIEETGGIGIKAQQERWSVEQLELSFDDAGAMFPFFSHQERPYFEHVLSKLPSWLAQASALDQLAYSKLMIAQVMWQSQSKGQTFLDGIDSLPAFAGQMLTASIKLQHPHSAVEVTRIDIHQVVIENLTLGSTREEITPLTEFALSYTGAKPSTLMAVVGREGEALPDWLTVDYVKNLVDELDIGPRYIALLKQTLVDDEAQTDRRLALYKSQLSLQLSLLALEKKIKGESGFTSSGWRLLHRLMRPDALLSAQNGRLCVRPLGFHAYADAPMNPVANMFVFGPQAIESGPFILYAPYARESLREFATWAALLDAIKQPGELQNVVLAWLDDQARGLYSDGGFERPHLESVLLEGVLSLLPRSPATLSTQYLRGDYVEAMFQAHVDTLITLADHTTVSTSQRRWNLFKLCAWTLFNGLTFFAWGPWQQAAWLFQTLISLRGGLQSLQAGDKQAFTQAVIDALFNISLALLHESLNFNGQLNDRLRIKTPVDEPVFTLFDDEAGAPVEKPAPIALTPKKLPDSHPATAVQSSALDFSWFSPNLQLTPRQRQDLATFAVNIDLNQGLKNEAGPLQGIISYQGKSYVQLDGQAYRVTSQVDGLVIQDSKQPERLGPRLRRIQAGQWGLDMRLGLRGGSPKKRLEQARDEKIKLCDEIVTEIAQLQLQGTQQERPLKVTEGLLELSGALRADFVTRYEADLKPWAEGHKKKLGLMARAETIISVPGVNKAIQEGWTALALRYFKLHGYLEKQHKALPMGASSTVYFDARELALQGIKAGNPALYERWIEEVKQIEILESRLFNQVDNQLEVLGKIRKESLPKGSDLLTLLAYPLRDLFTRNWVVRYLETLCELVLKKDASGVTVEEQRAFSVISQSSLINFAWSHIGLAREKEGYAAEHFALLEGSIKAYQEVESICLNLQTLHSDFFRNEYLASLEEVVIHLRTFAETQLAMVIRDSESSSSELDEPRPGPSRLMRPVRTKSKSEMLRQRTFKTMTEQTFSGTLREPVAGTSADIVDVGAQSGDGLPRSLAAYRRLEGDQWESISSSGPPSPIPELNSMRKNLARLMGDGRSLLARVDSAILENRARAVTSNIPLELEEIMEFKARSLEAIAQKIDEVVAEQSAEYTALGQEDKALTPTLSRELKAGALKLRAEGRALRISRLKQLPPTGAGVEYLKMQGEVVIAAVGGRRYLSKGQRKDYLQEFSIKDRQGHELWFAHVHYPTLGAAVNDFDVAHLKLADQRFLSEKALYAKARDPHDYIAVYRAKMDREQVIRVFLAPRKDASGG